MKKYKYIALILSILIIGKNNLFADPGKKAEVNKEKPCINLNKEVVIDFFRETMFWNILILLWHFKM